MSIGEKIDPMTGLKIMANNPQLWFLLAFALLFQKSQSSWNWFQSSKEMDSNKNPYGSKGSVAEFSMGSLDNHKGLKLVENGKQKMVNLNSCWQNAYRNLFAGCSEILAAEEKRSRFAWHLSDCFQKDSGRPSFPFCETDTSMRKCLTNLENDERTIYLEFFLETNTICYQLQASAFKSETERLVNGLKMSAEFAEGKLENIEEKSEHLVQSANEVHDSLTSIDHRTQQLAQASKLVEGHIDAVLKHSEMVYEQSKGIAASQTEMQEGQLKMRVKLEEGMAVLQDSYDDLHKGIDSLENEAVEIEKKINIVGEEMSLKMKKLQTRADDIGNMAGITLMKQKELLDGQSTALEGLQFLRKFQAEALEESRGVLQELVEFGRKQQEELLRRQKQLQQAYDHLAQNSKSILAAQEVFESKQETLFLALDKLFALHNAMLFESRLIKAFFVYSLCIFIIYMFTSTKQTHTVRPWLYLELCATFLIELAVMRLITNDIEQQAWIISLVRTLFMLLATAQLLHAIYTYRDYESLNHQMLLTLIEKVNCMQRNKELTWNMEEEEEEDVNWSTWVDTDLKEDVGNSEDPDFGVREICGNPIVVTPKRYDLRSRNGYRKFT